MLAKIRRRYQSSLESLRLICLCTCAVSTHAMPMVFGKTVAPLSAQTMPINQAHQISQSDTIVAATAQVHETQNAQEVAIMPKQSIEGDKISSFIVRAEDDHKILLSMLVTIQADLTQTVRALLNENVTPVVFSVSTPPGQTAEFDPGQFQFEQKSRSWRPTSMNGCMDIWALENNCRFGGKILEGEVHQGIILLPEWLDPGKPMILRYGKANGLIRLAQ